MSINRASSKLYGPKHVLKLLFMKGNTIMKYQIYDVIDNKYYLKNDSGTTIIVSKETLKKCFWQVMLGVYVEK